MIRLEVFIWKRASCSLSVVPVCVLSVNRAANVCRTRARAESTRDGGNETGSGGQGSETRCSCKVHSFWIESWEVPFALTRLSANYKPVNHGKLVSIPILLAAPNGFVSCGCASGGVYQKHI